MLIRVPRHVEALPGESQSVLAIAGSLRRDSYNRALLEAAVEMGPPDMTITVYESLDVVPLFNEDLEAASLEPPGVSSLRRAVNGSDGLLVATPEYNQSIPGVLKNAIDWLSRGAEGGSLAGLPVAITGATTGPWGTRLAQAALRQVLVATGATVMSDPMLFVSGAASVFEHGRLTDPATRDRLRALLSGLNGSLVHTTAARKG